VWGPFSPADQDLHFAGGELAAQLDGRVRELSGRADLRWEGALAREESPFLHGEGLPQALRVRLREAYAQWAHEPLRLRAGYQIASFGRSRWIRPADPFNRRDIRVRTSDPREMRFGMPGVRGDLELGPVTGTLLWVPVQRPMILVPAPAIEPLPFAPASLRDLSWSRPEVLARAEVALPGDARVALGLFSGFPASPELIRAASPEDIRLALRPHYPRVLKALFEAHVPLGPVWLDYESSLREVPDPPAGDIRTRLQRQYNHVLRAAWAGPRAPLHGWVQVIQWFTAGTDELKAEGRPALYTSIFKAQEEPVQTSLAAGVAARLPRTPLRLELWGAVHLLGRDYWVLPKVIWTPSERLALAAGATWMAGAESTPFDTLDVSGLLVADDLTPFGRNRLRSAVWVELRYRL